MCHDLIDEEEDGLTRLSLGMVVNKVANIGAGISGSWNGLHIATLGPFKLSRHNPSTHQAKFSAQHPHYPLDLRRFQLEGALHLPILFLH